MPKIDFSNMSLADLKAHARDVQQAITDFERTKRAEALAEIEAVAAKYGFKAADLLGGKAPKASRAKGIVAPKYRHPENPSITWSGRGRQPGWIKDGLAKGKKMEDFAI